jgi:hypothetical protein
VVSTQNNFVKQKFWQIDSFRELLQGSPFPE